MGKKEKSTDLLLERVEREREWMYRRWQEHMTVQQIAAAAALPISRGGLRLNISPAGVREMIRAYRTSIGDIVMSREDRRERQGDGIDMRLRLAEMDREAAYREIVEIAALQPEPDATSAERIEFLAMKQRSLDGLRRWVEGIDRRLEAAQKREAELFALAEPPDNGVDTASGASLVAIVQIVTETVRLQRAHPDMSVEQVINEILSAVQ